MTEIRELGDEDARLERQVVDLTLDKQIPGEVVQNFEASAAACWPTGFTSGTRWRSDVDADWQCSCPRRATPKSTARDLSALRLPIRGIAHACPRSGHLRSCIHVMRRREGWAVNKQRIHRRYRREGLQWRMRRRKRTWLPREAHRIEIWPSTP
jgi:hypothetical protein